MDRKLILLLFLFFLSFAFLTAVIIFRKPVISLIRAKEEFAPSRQKSKIIVWPLTVKADGLSGSLITVFVISVSDKPLSNNIVSLENSLGIIEQNSITTDNNGKADFKIRSSNPGIAIVKATINSNIKIDQQVSIKFE